MFLHSVSVYILLDHFTKEIQMVIDEINNTFLLNITKSGQNFIRISVNRINCVLNNDKSK